MHKGRSIFYNSSASIINQIIVLISGFLVPRILLTYYGSDMNGLVSSITQFISYFNIVEAGLGGAAIFSLYKPIAEKNHILISKIVSTTTKLYYQVGAVFLFFVLLLSLFYPLVIKTNLLSSLEISILIFVLGMKGVIDFFSLARFRALLTADKRIYVVLNVMSISQILNIIIIVLMAIFKANIVLIYTLALGPLAFRSIVLYLYVRKKYPYIDYTEKKDSKLLNNRWDVLYLNIVQAAQSGAPTMIATFTVGLAQVSVYSIYNVVFSGVNMLFSVLTNSLMANFGELIAKNSLEKLQKLYGCFEFVYTQVIAIVYGVTLIVLIPFINLYTGGIENSQYIVPVGAFLFVVNGFSYNIKSPQGMMIMAAGHYKETRMQSSIQAGILIIFGILLSIRGG